MLLRTMHLLACWLELGQKCNVIKFYFIIDFIYQASYVLLCWYYTLICKIKASGTRTVRVAAKAKGVQPTWLNIYIQLAAA